MQQLRLLYLLLLPLLPLWHWKLLLRELEPLVELVLSDRPVQPFQACSSSGAAGAHPPGVPHLAHLLTGDAVASLETSLRLGSAAVPVLLPLSLPLAVVWSVALPRAEVWPFVVWARSA